MLVPEKCSFAIVRHKLENNDWKTENRVDTKISIHITNDKGEKKEIKQNNNQKGELTLGIMFSPTNAMDDEMHHLQGKMENWADKVRTGHLKKQDAWLCLQTTIMRTIE
jgi:hypothetical protein